MDDEVDLERLRRLLGGPEMTWLVERIRQRLQSADAGSLSGVVTLSAPSSGQRAAASRLVGASRRSSTTLRVELAKVEEVLRRGPWPRGLADAVVTLTGPVADRRGEAAREATAWDAARDLLLPTLQGRTQLSEWWLAWSKAGGLKRIAGTESRRRGCASTPTVAADLVSSAARVLSELPADGEPLSVLARRVIGDAHALDAARPLGRLVQSIVRQAFPAPAENGAEPSVRETWAAAGVVLSAVSSTVIALGVPGARVVSAGSKAAVATATALEAMHEARMPVVLTLEQVRSGGVGSLPADETVFVCENPTVVEVVGDMWRRTSADGAPTLVCTYGQPSMAVIEMLRILTAEGASCRYHGDFDWGGLRIAQALARHVPWTPWRFGATDYQAALEAEQPSRPLTGTPSDSPWDPELARTMRRAGHAIEEEAVADLLAADLVLAE